MGTLTWTAPEYDGGVPVLGYKVVTVHGDGTRVEVEYGDDVFSHTYDENVEGEIFVVAKNAVGYSQAGTVVLVEPWIPDPELASRAPTLTEVNSPWGYATGTGELSDGRQYATFRMRNPRESFHQYTFTISDTSGAYSWEWRQYPRNLARPTTVAELIANSTLGNSGDQTAGVGISVSPITGNDDYLLISDETGEHSGSLSVIPSDPVNGAHLPQSFEYPAVVTLDDPQLEDVSWYSTYQEDPGADPDTYFERWFVFDSDGSPFQVTVDKWPDSIGANVGLDVFTIPDFNPAASYPDDISDMIAVGGDFQEDLTCVVDVPSPAADRHWIKVSVEDGNWYGWLKIVGTS